MIQSGVRPMRSIFSSSFALASGSSSSACMALALSREEAMAHLTGFWSIQEVNRKAIRGSSISLHGQHGVNHCSDDR